MYMTRLSVASGNATETQDTDVCIMHLPKFLGIKYLSVHTS